MKVYVCQEHHYDGGVLLAVFDTLDNLKKYMKENNDNDETYLIPYEVLEVEMNKSYHQQEYRVVTQKELKYK